MPLFSLSLRLTRGTCASLLLLVCTASGAQELTIAPEAEPYREALLAWSASLKSFSGEYEMVHSLPGVPEFAESPPAAVPLVFRMDGDNIYFRKIRPLEDGGRRTTYIVQYDGQIDYLHQFDYISLQEDYNMMRRDAGYWPIPREAYLTPLLVFHACRLESLPEFMSKGVTVLYRDGDRPVLSHRRIDVGPNAGDRLDVRFDDSGRVERFVWGIGVTATEEELLAAGAGDPYAMFRVQGTLDLLRYENVGGIAFPVSVYEVTYAYSDQARIERISERLRNQEITALEFQIQTRRDSGPRHEFGIKQYDLKPLTYTVNEPLPRSAFKLPLARGDELFLPGKKHPEIYPGAWYERPGFWIGVGVAVLLLAGAFAAYRTGLVQIVSR